jgi:hypothetical protein
MKEDRLAEIRRRASLIIRGVGDPVVHACQIANLIALERKEKNHDTK